ncbi:DHA2 family efflux MFS transporter permease subunit [Planobispora rosea]|uniref:DHA2 family efflux MFS transporter permease subunit n=1 Tax=Planobispora rosea TaxID=35762 RepID=UPI00083A4143|nr:DHA2 family efflux MFS transporter permease subunit [Planobispora rosea]
MIGSRSTWALTLVTAACVLLTLDITIVNVALPAIRNDLGSGLAGLQWVINAYTLVFASVLLTAGSLADSAGRRRVFTGGLAVFTLASLACGLAPSTVALNVFRAVQGLGGAFAFAPAMAIIAGSYGGAARTRAIAIFGAATIGAGALGPLAGGVLVETLGWRSMFLINVPLGAALLWLALRRLEADPPAGRVRVDVIGVLTLTTGVAAVTLALLQGASQGWSSTATLAQAGAGVLALAVFVVSQARGAHPLLDLSLFRIRSFTGAAVSALLVRLVGFGLMAYLVLFLSAGYSYDAFDVGLRLLGMSAPLMAGGLAAVRLGARVPPGGLIAAGFVVSAAGLAALTAADAGGSWARLLPGLVLLGFGLGLVSTPGMTVVMSVVPPSRTGTASGVIQSFLPLGTTLGTAVFGLMFSAHLHAATGAAPALAGLDAGTRERIAGALEAGRIDAVAAAVPAPLGETAAAFGRDAIAGALSLLGVVAAALAVAGALLGALLIRRGDLLHTGEEKTPASRQATPDTA